jgi:deoxycytidylate deaminase
MTLSNTEIRNLMWEVYHRAQRSTDRSTNNGAILINEDHDPVSPLVIGYNAHLPGWGDKEEHHERPLKYSVTEHAERDVIYRAAYHGICTRGLTMIANWVACPDCARGIVLPGIRRIICHKQCMDRTPPRWKEMVDLGLEMCEKNKVPIVQWDGRVGNCKNLNSGEIWYP